MKPKRHRLSPSDFDRSTIRQNYTTLSDAEIATLLQRSKNSVTNMRVSMGLFQSGRGKRFSNYELSFIRTNYHSLNDEQIAKELNRSVNSVCKMRYLLKCKRQRAYVDRYVEQKVLKMRSYIYLCEITTSPYMKDKYKEQLRVLSGL